MATGLVTKGVGFGGAAGSLVPLVDRDPGPEPPLDGADTEDGDMALRSEIIFCKLASASPPDSALCFLVAASTAASIAVLGAETGATRDRGAGAD